MTIGLKILIAALMMGLASDLLFHDSIVHSLPNGLSVLLWSVIVSAGVSIMTMSKSLRLDKRCLLWLAPANMFAFAYMWRDSATLHCLDAFLIFFSLAMLSFSLKGNVLQALGLTAYGRAMASTIIDSLVEALAVVKLEVPWRNLFPPAVRQSMPAVLRGAAFAAPLLLIFGALFVTADAAFAGLINKGLNVNLSEMAVHGVILIGFSWCAAGYMRPLFCTAAGAQPAPLAVSGDEKESRRPHIGRLELNVMLGLLNLLFVSFVLVQLRYFFGGASLVEATTHLTYADYARRGFFELTAVSALVLPMLLAGDWLLPRHCDKFDKVFPLQAAFQVLMLFVIMASAMQRMNLYQQEYGQTELRLYVSLFMIWMAAVYIIFMSTVLRAKRSRFAFPAVLSGFIAAAALQMANPDRIVVADNIARAQAGKDFDVAYALSLSDDAKAYLVRNISKLPQGAQKQLAASLIAQAEHAWHFDIRSYNIGRVDAYNAVCSQLPTLKEITAK